MGIKPTLEVIKAVSQDDALWKLVLGWDGPCKEGFFVMLSCAILAAVDDAYLWTSALVVECGFVRYQRN